MSTLQIRPATTSDIPGLCALGARTFLDTYTPISDPAHVADYARIHFTPDRIAGWLAAPRSVTLLALLGDEPAGYAYVLQDGAPDCVADRDAVHLSRLYLLRGAQGRRHGSALLGAALASAARMGGDSVWLGVYDRNPRAITFYERHGFRTVGTHEFPFGGEIFHDPVMTRRLDRVA